MLPRSLSFNLEPTFRCNLECPMCPRFSSEDPHLDMAMDTYLRIVEVMPYAHTVDFTGWGEPLLHRGIYEMVETARRQGCLTTMTSNGTALNEANSRALVQSGLDRLTISVDGFTSQTYDRIRQGASFERLTRNLTGLTQIIRKTGSPMELGIAYTAQETNIDDVDGIVPWMQSVGAKVLHLKHLNVISNRDDWERSFLKYRLHPVQQNGDTLRKVEERLTAVQLRAIASGFRVMVHSELPLTAKKQARHCLATPLNSVYFSYEGRLAPCCHFGHHVSRYYEGQQYAASALFFGDIRRQEFLDIWNDARFQDFRRGFVTGQYPEACRSCYLLYGK